MAVEGAAAVATAVAGAVAAARAAARAARATAWAAAGAGTARMPAGRRLCRLRLSHLAHNQGAASSWDHAALEESSPPSPA